MLHGIVGEDIHSMSGEGSLDRFTRLYAFPMAADRPDADSLMKQQPHRNAKHWKRSGHTGAPSCGNQPPLRQNTFLMRSHGLLPLSAYWYAGI